MHFHIKPHNGSQASRFSHSVASDTSQTTRSSSIAVARSRLCGTRKTPGLRFPAFLKLRKWTGIVLISCETNTRDCDAASARTSGSLIPRNPAACAVRKSTAGSRRRTPVTMTLLRSASARKRTFTRILRAARRERASIFREDRPAAVRHRAFLPPTSRSAESGRHRCRAGLPDRR